jgi:hypothetical protein
MDEDPETIVRNIGYYVSKKEYKKGIDSLSPQEKIFFVVFDFEMELYNGGVAQYLVNSSGNNANEVSSALYAIGAIKSAELIRGFLYFFPEHQLPVDRGDRWHFLRTYQTNLEYKRMEEDISTKYCEDEEGIFTLLYRFYDQNKHNFDPLNYDVPLSLFECEFD